MHSAQRALTILRVVYRSGQGKLLAEVAAETGLDKATTSRILTTLVAEGIIYREAVAGRYLPDMRSWLYVAPSVVPGQLLATKAQEILDLLSKSAGCLSELVLAVPDGRTSAVVMESHNVGNISYQSSRRFLSRPLHASAAGQCILAGSSPDQRDHYLQHYTLAESELAGNSLEELRSQLTELARLGYATSVGEILPNFSSIAIPLSVEGKGVIGALALIIPGTAPSKALLEMLPRLQAAQQALSFLFSYDAWLDLVKSTPSPTSSSASPWDTGDPGFGDGPVPLVRTVSRLMRLMAAIFKQPEGASVRELARQRGLDKTTAWRLLNTLCASDVLWQDGPNERYRISPGFWLRHAWIMKAATSLTQVVTGELHKIALATGATALLAIPDREGTRCIPYCYSFPHTPLCYHPENDPHRELHIRATGKAYLAAISKRALERYLAQGLTAITPKSITSRTQLLAALEQIRRAGYALSQEEGLAGVCSCAVPVYDAENNIAASLGVVALTPQLDPEEVAQWVPLLKDTARLLSRFLVGDWQSELARLTPEPLV